MTLNYRKKDAWILILVLGSLIVVLFSKTLPLIFTMLVMNLTSCVQGFIRMHYKKIFKNLIGSELSLTVLGIFIPLIHIWFKVYIKIQARWLHTSSWTFRTFVL